MLRFEIKKVFSKTVNKIALLILVVALLVVSFFAVNSVDYVDENGTSTSGIAAARNLRNDKNQWSGYLTDNVLSEAILKNEEEWMAIGQIEAVQPHLGDHMIGSLNSLQNVICQESDFYIR